MKLALVMTNDWELFGDGSGDFFEIQYEPTRKLLELANKYDAKITLMAECFQNWAHEDIADENDRAKEIANAWKESIISAINSGSDVQLHLHPQWMNAEYINDKWHLDMNKWALTALSEDEITKIISRGKNYLESILNPVKKEYACICFRAGSYCIQPSKKVIPALVKNGIKCDSSVTKGLFEEEFYDFRNACSNLFPWFVEDDIIQRSPNETQLIEYPIYSVNRIYSELISKFNPKLGNRISFGLEIPRHELEWAKKRDHIKERRYPRHKRYYKQKETRDLKWYMKKVVSNKFIQLDYDYLPASLFVKLIINLYYSDTLKKYREMDVLIPVIASGHIKDVPDMDNIRKILELIDSEHRERIDYVTLSDAVQIALENDYSKKTEKEI